LADLNGDFLPPAEAATHVQGMVDRGRNRSPHWPHDPISKWYQLPWAPGIVQDGLNNFGSVYGFLAAWFRWGIMSLCLEREEGGQRFWSIGQFFSYFLLLMKVGHEATKDPDLKDLTVVTFVQRYDIALRSKFHLTTSTLQAFDLNNFLKDTSEKTYKEVKLAYLKLEADKKKQRQQTHTQQFSGSAPQGTRNPNANAFRSSQRFQANTQPRNQQPSKPETAAQNKTRPAPHSIPTLCRNWEQHGTCEYGSNCIFQHDSEKRGVKRQSDDAPRAKREQR